MKAKLQKILKECYKTLGEDTDVLIITHKDGQCGVVAHGETDSLAEAYFASMHNFDDEAYNTLYRILKLNIMNILANPSPLAIDLTDAITSVIPDESE